MKKIFTDIIHVITSYRVKTILKVLPLLAFFFPFIAVGQQQYGDLYYDVDTTGTPTTSIAEYVHDEVIDEPQGFMQRLLSIFRLNRFASGTTPETGETLGATNFLVFIINIAISLSAFIAVVVLISGFAMMLFASEEEGIAKAKKYIFGAAVAIFILGISWFIVSAIFYIYNAIRL